MMPFKPSTAKKYARLILQWVLPIVFALIVLNGAYRGFTEELSNMSLFELHYLLYSWIVLVTFIFIGVVRTLLWVFSDQD